MIDLKKLSCLVLIIAVLIFSLTACGSKDNNADEGSSTGMLQKTPGFDAKAAKEEAVDVKIDDGKLNITIDTEEGNMEFGVDIGETGNNLSLPENFPVEIFPLSDDANVVNVNQNGFAGGLSVSYVSRKDKGTLLDLYLKALSNAENLEVFEIEIGHMLNGNIEGITFYITIGEGLFNEIPEHKGKQCVTFELIGVEKLSGDELLAQAAKDGGEPWPSSELPDIPELKGYIGSFNRVDDVVYVEGVVESIERVTDFIEELKESGYFFEDEPDTEEEYIQFVAYKDNNLINFAYKRPDNSVFIEYWMP